MYYDQILQMPQRCMQTPRPTLSQIHISSGVIISVGDTTAGVALPAGANAVALDINEL